VSVGQEWRQSGQKEEGDYKGQGEDKNKTTPHQGDHKGSSLP